MRKIKTTTKKIIQNTTEISKSTKTMEKHKNHHKSSSLSSLNFTSLYFGILLLGFTRATFAASWASASNTAGRQIQPQYIEYQEGSSVSLRPYQSPTPERLAALDKGYFLEWKYAAV